MTISDPSTPSEQPPPSDTTIQNTLRPEDTLQVATVARPWNPIAIAWICVFFTILPAGIMYTLNFERLGQPEKKKRALFLVLSASIIYYIAQIGIFFLVLVHPSLETMSTSINVWFFIIGIAMAWYFYLRQQAIFKTRLQQGARKAPIYVPLLLSGLWMATFPGALFGWAYFENYQHMRSFDKAVALMEKGQYQQAETALQDYHARYPDDIAAHWNLATIYLQTDRVPQARQIMRELLRQDPNNKEAQDFLQELDTY